MAAKILFPSHIGSRSTCSFLIYIYAYRFVSIPHWFSLNTSTAKSGTSFSGFHPTLVLAQRKRYLLLHQKDVVFPSHIGSRSTRRQDSIGRSPTQFPSHIGSRSTVQRGILYVITFFVSIPHWFSLNGFHTPLLLHYITSFHPTLVLAQQGNREGSGTQHTAVSIPHWFSLNKLQEAKKH